MIGEFRLHAADLQLPVAADAEADLDEALEVLRRQRLGRSDAVDVHVYGGGAAWEAVPVGEFGGGDEAAAAGRQAEHAAVTARRREEWHLD